MRKYTFVFAGAYLALSAAIALLTAAVQLADGGSLNLLAALAAALFTAHWFVRDQQRAPTVPQARAFAWQALLCVWVVTVLVAAVLAAVLAPGSGLGWLRLLGASNAALAMAAASIVVVSLVYWILLRWSFGWYAGRLARR